MRRPHDFYITPEHYVNALFKYVAPTGTVVEPCVGDGAISRFLPGAPLLTNDIDTARCAQTHMDATDENYWAYGVFKADWCVTNPPFKHAFTILKHAVEYCHNVAMILPVNFFEPTKQRVDWLVDNPPSGVIYLPRYSFTGNGRNAMVTCCWGIWGTELIGVRIAPRFQA
jgi:hypothetical protein